MLDVKEIQTTLDNTLGHYGFECHPFKMGWYNERVSERFRYDDVSDDTLAFLVVSAPCMFERAFCSYLTTKTETELVERRDPIDECIRQHFLRAVKAFPPEHQPEPIHDYELTYQRRPKFLMQTAGHVSGAAFYYQRCDVTGEDPWPNKKRIYGVSVHPRYGGWFGLRGVLLFRSTSAPQLQFVPPTDLLTSRGQRVQLLTAFNGNWRDAAFRSVIRVEQEYSSAQKKYFDIWPKDRLEYIKQLRLDAIKNAKLSA